MRNRPVMRLALAGWLAAAAVAAARGIPVYREYTVPISFVDESAAEFAAAELCSGLACLGRRIIGPGRAGVQPRAAR